MELGESRDCWRGVVLDLAGPDVQLREGVAPDRENQPMIELTMEGAYFRAVGRAKADAYVTLACQVGTLRLAQHLETLGWTGVEEMIDQTTYVIGTDPSGVRWGIGVAPLSSDLRGYLVDDIASDGVAERMHVVEPLALVTPEAFANALAGPGALPVGPNRASDTRER
jgi:hypothetical protein